MKLYPSWFVFMSMNLVGVIIVSSSSNWFMVWVGFELSLLGFLPMFLVNKLVIESMVKYFLIQASGSSLFLLSFLVSVKGVSVILFVLSVFLKVGLFPFFQWVPVIMVSMSWGGCFILSTFQKMGPLVVLLKTNLSSVSLLFLWSGGLSIFFSGILGVNQTNMRSLLGYSSVSHMGWMVSSLVFSQNLVLLYFAVYFWIMVLLFVELDLSHMNSVVSSKSEEKNTIKIYLVLFVLTGMPPFSVFFLKMVILLYLLNYFAWVVLMMLGVMMSVYFYMGFIIPSFLKSFQKTNMSGSDKMVKDPMGLIFVAFSVPLTALL